jgi:hypothetical protein
MITTTSYSLPVIERNQNPRLVNSSASLQNNNSGPYEGRLRVYLVQPLSKWKDHDGKPYHFAFIDFPLINKPPFLCSKFDEDISIGYLETYSKTITWSGSVSENNVIVIAGVYDARSEIKDSYNNENPFYAHYLDAAAGARPGETTYNTVNKNFTHTVLVEVATEHKCPNCPAMEEALYNLSKSGEYPFYFINMVFNKNQYASGFMFDPQEGYNQAVVPEAYFDGGYEILVGGVSNKDSYISRINNCGKRDVHQLNLSLSVVWKGSGKLEISIHITNNEEVHYPSKPAPPSSPSDVFRRWRMYTFTGSTTDPDGDDLYYLFEYWSYFYGTTNSGWLGPYHSGEVANTTHIFNRKDFFEVRVTAKDIHNEKGPRSEPLAISVE